MSKYTKIIKNKWAVFGSGLLLGAIVILGIRFATYQPVEAVHYHANFAVYVNGQKEQFKGTQYYEETEATVCTLNSVATANERAHMHNNVNDVVHIEDHLVTWGNFMQNIHYGIGDDYIRTTDTYYANNDQSKLSFILNGEKVSTVADKIIDDKDKLLISYGNATDDELQKLYNAIPATAQKYDTSQDPASCSGHKMENNSRLMHLF